MGTTRKPITISGRARNRFQPAPAEADASVANADSQPPAAREDAPAAPALSVVRHDSAASTPDPASSLTTQDRPDPASPNPGAEKDGTSPTVKFTLDIPLELHRAMQIQKIRARTPIVDTVRTILSKYYRTSAEISPGVYPLQKGEQTRRSTFDLDEDLVIEMNMQKVLRDAKIKDEVRQLLANHYLPGGATRA